MRLTASLEISAHPIYAFYCVTWFKINFNVSIQTTIITEISFIIRNDIDVLIGTNNIPIISVSVSETEI